MNFQIRIANQNDYHFIRQMLFQAIFVEPGQQPPDLTILENRAISKYIENWGRAGDIAMIAYVGEKNIGAAWIRIFSSEHKGFGWVDEKTPELSMAVDYEFRSKGVGTQLLKALLETIKIDFKQVSLSVSPNNPVLRLYKRFGFQKFGICGTSITLIKIFDGT